MSRIICRHALNNYGSFMVGKLIEPAIDSAVAANAYQLLRARRQTCDYQP